MPSTPTPFSRTLLLLFALALPAYAQNPAPEFAHNPPAGRVVSEAPTDPAVPPDVRPGTPVTDAERSAIEITSISLDLHLVPAASREEAHATLTLRNRSDVALTRVPLQLSSTLHWLAASAPTGSSVQPVVFTQSPITTDADHTGYAQEAVFTLGRPLPAGASTTFSVFFAGEIKPNADRLELIGAPHDRAAATDWDSILPTSDRAATALRGFGNVLWYPVAAPVARLGDGNRLFTLIAQERRRNTRVSMHLRLTVVYTGDPPDAAIFDGQLQPLSKVPDGQNLVIDDTQGVATAEFPLAPVGFRTPSLFLTAQVAASVPGSSLTSITPDAEAAKPYDRAVHLLSPVLAALLGPGSRSQLLLLDHPGEPFEDAAFVAASLSASADPAVIAPRLVRALTHAWLRGADRQPAPASLWVDEGLAEFVALVYTERTKGRDAALDELRHAAPLIALAAPEPLTEAASDAALRAKSAFIFWQLREILGDAAFTESLAAWRHSLALNPGFDTDPRAFEHSLERTSGRDLAWFFDDWVYAARTLPDLSIVSANPRPLGAHGGKVGGSLVAVEVHNDGSSVAEVPVTVRSGTLAATERLRIPAHASASTRIVFEGTPDLVEVNDGSVPELRTSSHTVTITPATP